MNGKLVGLLTKEQVKKLEHRLNMPESLQKESGTAISNLAELLRL